MIQLAIVEDEDAYAEQLTQMVLRYEKEKDVRIHITRYTDGDEIAENYPGGFDMILMDIQMRFMDGMTAAEKIRKVDKEVLIMFITNRTDYAIRGYQVDAIDYVLKPVTYPAFSQKMDRAMERLSRHEGFLVTIATSEGMMRLDVGEIYYVESEGHNLIYHTKRGNLSMRERIQDAEEKLKDHGFFRTNKGCLVNLEHVEGVKDGCCLIQGEMLPISRARKNDFMQALTNFVSRM